MKLFDSHCHLDDRAFVRDMRIVQDRMRAAGVRAAMIAGISRRSAARAVALAEGDPSIFAAVGVHPHDASSCTEDDLAALADMSRHPRVRAWGEIGLDFNRMVSPMDVQERWFRRQLEIADALGMPLIFHERDTRGRFLELLQAARNPSRHGVVHCFSGTDDELAAYLQMGLHIGITGILTMRSRGSRLRRQAAAIPAERLLIETDAPYLTPAPERNRYRRNEPAFVRSVLFKLAEVRSEDPKMLAEITWHNTCELFDIPAG